jgi:HD-GYP domain-containing protein (c-di-GMP phosphodiesterase class II)
VNSRSPGRGGGSGPPPVNVIEFERLEQQITDLEASAVCALSMLLDLKDLKTGLHTTRLTEWAMRVGEQLDLSENQLRDIENASMLHDIGKIGVPDQVLFKPGVLTEDEKQLVQKHSEYGWGILRKIPCLENTSLLVLHHHEWFDGSGYPGGLEGDQIPLGARIVAVVDAFDAMLSDRSYRQGLPMEEAMRRLHQGGGTQFDPKIVDLFDQIARSDLEEVSELATSAA